MNAQPALDYPPPEVYRPVAAAGQVSIEAAAQARLFLSTPEPRRALDAVPDPLVVLNLERRIVFANRAMLPFAKVSRVEELIGLRMGELFRCEHRDSASGGCGAGECCRYCATVNSILGSQRRAVPVQGECRLTVENGAALDLRVTAAPYELRGHALTLLTIQDSQHEKRRHALEKIFFHDLLNTASGVHSVAGMLSAADVRDPAALKEVLVSLSRQMIDEIRAQQQLLEAEAGGLEVKWSEVRASKVVENVVALYRHSPLAHGKQISVEGKSEDVVLRSDPALLARVLGNMVKNALEAIAVGESVRVWCCRDDGVAQFHVHNAGYMPEPVQRQIFHRSFSTKGTGRGLGTHSMKLLTERFLGGSVGFVSKPQTGTTFIASYPVVPRAGEAPPPRVGD